jgi:hypothetical protein
VQDIIFTNQWKRPIYFAVTVATDSRIGLEDYMWFHGLAWRLEPRRVPDADRGIDGTVLESNLFNEPRGYSTTPQFGYKFRGIADSKVYFDENTSRLMINYRAAFIRLALYQQNIAKQPEKSIAALERMEQIIPQAKVPMGWDLLSDIALFYHRLGRDDRFNELAVEVERAARKVIDSGQANMNSYYNPYRVLLEIYEARKDYAKELELLNTLALLYPNDSGIKQRINEVQTGLKSQQASLPPTSK